MHTFILHVLILLIGVLLIKIIPIKLGNVISFSLSDQALGKWSRNREVIELIASRAILNMSKGSIYEVHGHPTKSAFSVRCCFESLIRVYMIYKYFSVTCP